MFHILHIISTEKFDETVFYHHNNFFSFSTITSSVFWT